MSPVGLRRSYHPGAFAPVYPGDPAPADLPPTPTAHYGAAVLNARAVGLAPADRPQQFTIADRVLGPSQASVVDARVLAASIETLALLGMNCVQADDFGTQQVTAQGVMAAWGITTSHYAVYHPNSSWTWDTPYSDPDQTAAWATARAAEITSLLQVPLSSVRFYHMADEPSWYSPNQTALLLSKPTAVTAFRTYLQGRGFAPSDFGQSAWGDVLPIQYSGATDLPTRRLLFWTLRFLATTYADQQVLNTAALRETINATLLTALNYNNGARWFAPSPNQNIAASDRPATPDTAWAAPDWWDYGHKAVGAVHWTEDWFPNTMAEYWSFRADQLRSAAQLSGTPFGGYVIGLALSQGTPVGGRYKALTLLGKGAKVLMWYTFGPSEQFPGNGYSNNPEAYREIVDANRLIARAEDLLYPGQPLTPKIALLVPMSSQVWDLHDDLATRADSASQLPHCLDELFGLHFALTQSQYPVDFLSEFDVPTRLANYQVLYVTGPNLTASAQSAIATWIAAGGVAWFGPGTAVADEYNTATTTLDALKGITTQTLPRQWDIEDFVASQAPCQVLAVTVNGEALCATGTDQMYMQLERLAVTTATTLAQFTDDSSAAIVAQATGNGWALTCGTWLGANYMATSGSDPNGLLGPYWSARMREMLTLPARVAGVVRPVTCDQPLVELARLDSTDGVAITLLNWNNAPISALTVTAVNCPPIARAVLADQQESVAFAQVGGAVTVTVPLETVDVLKLYASA